MDTMRLHSMSYTGHGNAHELVRLGPDSAITMARDFAYEVSKVESFKKMVALATISMQKYVHCATKVPALIDPRSGLQSQDQPLQSTAVGPQLTGKFVFEHHHLHLRM